MARVISLKYSSNSTKNTHSGGGSGCGGGGGGALDPDVVVT